MSGSDQHALETELLEVAVEAARAAARELMPRWRRPLHIGTKSTPTDPVTEADVNAERAIREVLARRRPADSILGEEGGQTGDGGLRWVVDPLDGTVNFMYGLPTFAVSVAVEDADGALAGAVLDPVRDELFTATRSGGVPVCNGEPISATTCDDLAQALVGTGFAYDAEVRVVQAAVAARIIPRARDIRRAGSAALDMVWCASGRLDAYWERGVHAWDIAAGTLICERAGLVVRPLVQDGVLPSGVLVATAALIDELTELVAGAPAQGAPA